MWNLHVTSKTYGIRPSQVACIEDPWVAYCFDSAVGLFGNHIEGKTQEMDKDGKYLYDIKDLLADTKTDYETTSPKDILLNAAMKQNGGYGVSVVKGKTK